MPLTHPVLADFLCIDLQVFLSIPCLCVVREAGCRRAAHLVLHVGLLPPFLRGRCKTLSAGYINTVHDTVLRHGPEFNLWSASDEPRAVLLTSHSDETAISFPHHLYGR